MTAYLEAVLPFSNGAYSVDTIGNVFSNARKVSGVRGCSRSLKRKQLKQITDQAGYKRVGLYVDGVQRQFLVHRLVGMMFLGLTDEKEINHKNLRKNDNTLDNLEVVSRAENVLHGHDNCVMGTPRKPVIGINGNDSIFLRSCSEATKVGLSIARVSKASKTNTKYRKHIWHNYKDIINE